MARPILILALFAPVLLPAQQDSATFSPVTREEVWQAVKGELRQRGCRAEQLPAIDDVELPVAVPAAGERALRVATLCWNAAAEHAVFRLECREAGQCIPFLAYTRGIDHSGLGSCRAGSVSAAKKPQAAAVRNGDRATLMLTANRLRLTSSVICLERGNEGEIIRVRNQEGRIFRARIAAPGFLEVVPQ